MASAWIEHVKSVAAKKKIPYKEALKVAKETYKPKGKGEKKAPMKKGKKEKMEM